MYVSSAFRRMSDTKSGRWGLAVELVLSVVFAAVISGAKHPWAGVAVVAALFGFACVVEVGLRWALGGGAQDPPTSSRGLRGQGRMDAMLTMPVFLIPAVLIAMAIRGA